MTCMSSTWSLVYEVMLYTYFGVTVLLDIFVLVKVRFSLDPSMYFIMAASLVSLFFKLPLIAGEGLNIRSWLSTMA